MRNLANYPLQPDEVVADLTRSLDTVAKQLNMGSTQAISLALAIEYIRSKPLTFQHWLAQQQAKQR